MRWFQVLLVAAGLAGLAGERASGQRVMLGGGLRGGTNLPQTVMDSRGNQWMIYPGGWLRQQTAQPNGGQYQIYSQGGMITFNGAPPDMGNAAAQLDAKTGELVLAGNAAPGGISLTRRILVNKEEGYVRYIDVFRNSQGQEQTLNVLLSSSFNYGVQGVTLMEDPKRKGQNFAAMMRIPVENQLVALEIFAGRGSKLAPSLNAQPNGNTMQASLRVAVPGGKEVAVMHLHSLFASAEAAGAFLKEFKESKLLATIPGSVRKLLVNWPGGQSWIGEVEVLRGDVLDTVEMRGGDQFRGTLQETGYKLETFYGPIELAAERVVGLINVGTVRPRQLLITVDGEIFGGQLQGEAVKLQLSSGQVTQIPLSQISRLGYRKRAGEPEEWTFEQPMVFLASGERISVEMPQAPIEIATRYGLLKLEPKLLAAITFQGEDQSVHEVVLADGSKLAGLAGAAQFEMTLADGRQKVKFPAASLARLQLMGKAPEADDGQASLQLSNGDQLVGAFQGQLKVATSFDTITLNTNEIRRLARSGTSVSDVQVSLWDDTTVSGQLQGQELDFVTKCGVSLKVPLALIGEYLQPQPRPSAALAERIKALVADLGAEDWKQRDRAEAALLEMGPIVSGLLKELRGGQSPEAQQRIEVILKQLDKRPARSSTSGG